MPAPRLLDKKLVNASLATERRQEIEKGVKIAKAIDAVRETRAKEEAELEQFRRETIARVQVEIDAKIAERDSIARDIPRLKEERIRAQAPINLKEEWQKVRIDREANSAWQEKNTQQAIELLAREEDCRAWAERLVNEEESIKDEHALSLRTLEEADKKFAQADDALTRAEQSAQAILKDAQERENHLRVREEDATAREVQLSKREKKVEEHEANLSAREQKLKSRQETFIKAQKYITNRKK